MGDFFFHTVFLRNITKVNTVIINIDKYTLSGTIIPFLLFEISTDDGSINGEGFTEGRKEDGEGVGETGITE